MGYAVYFDDVHSRFAGYGVPCQCEHPDCKVKINRGLGCLCGDAPGGGERGCGLYFCGEHLLITARRGQICERCANRRRAFAAKPDTREWTKHMLRDASWKQWRDENPTTVKEMKQAVLAKTER